MEANELITFGILAAVVVIIAIVARRGQTPHRPPSAKEDVSQNASVQEPKGPGAGTDLKGRSEPEKRRKR